MKRLALAMSVTGVVALAPLAQAADLAVKAAPAAIDPGYNWTGFYAGIHAGMGFANNQFFDVIGGTDAAVFTARGVFGGGQLGFNWQAGRWVFGAEAEGSLSHLQRGVFGGGGFGGGGFGQLAGAEALASGLAASLAGAGAEALAEASAAAGSEEVSADSLVLASRRSGSCPPASATLGIVGSST